MKRAIFATALLLAPAAGWSQTPDQQAQEQGMQATVMDQLQLVATKNTEIVALKARLADLQKQLADAKKETPK